MALYNSSLVSGKSAYDAAVKGGYKGTEEEFNSMLSEVGLVLTATLVAGNTSVVITDDRITSNSTLESVLTSVFGIKVKSAVFAEGSLTLTFPVQTENVEVKAYLNLGSVEHKVVGNGKSAYQYAVDGGYTGTEEEFKELMGTVAEIEDKVEEIINSSQGSNEWKLVGSATGVTSIALPTEWKEIYVNININNSGNNVAKIVLYDLATTSDVSHYMPWNTTWYAGATVSRTNVKLYLANNNNGDCKTGTVTTVYYR